MAQRMGVYDCNARARVEKQTPIDRSDGAPHGNENKTPIEQELASWEKTPMDVRPDGRSKPGANESEKADTHRSR